MHKMKNYDMLSLPESSRYDKSLVYSSMPPPPLFLDIRRFRQTIHVVIYFASLSFSEHRRIFFD